MRVQTAAEFGDGRAPVFWISGRRANGRFTVVRFGLETARQLRDDLTDALDRMCETCHGTGETKGGGTCPDCHGHGEVLEAPEDEGTGR